MSAFESKADISMPPVDGFMDARAGLRAKVER
jgi:hypothetical protein